MNETHKYTLVLLLCIIIFIILIVIIPSTVKNNKSIEILNKKNKALAENSKMDNKTTFGYSDILKVLNENNFKIISIYGSESHNINIQASFEGSMMDFNKYINIISNYRNLTSIDNIAIEDPGKKILVNIKFIKNK